MDEGMTRADLASRLGISPATVRKWEAYFSDRMVTPPGRRGQNAPLILDPADVRTLSAVAELRARGYSLEETAARLDQHLATAAPPLLPELRPLEASAATVSPGLYADALRAIEAAEATAAAVSQERDYLRRRVEDLEARLIEEAAGRAAAEERARTAGSRPGGIWAWLTGRGREAE